MQFACQNDALDLYLRTQAGQDARRHIAATFVLVEAARAAIIVGYYTLSASGIDLGTLPPETARKLPRYPIVPATLIGRLAVDYRCRSQGAGEYLLMDALRRAMRQSRAIASAVVIVDAADDDAWRFYRHFDFIAFPMQRDRLFLPMKTLAKLFAEPGTK
jgi:ribosomal protein S18 acetylase RimI-like enzyme